MQGPLLELADLQRADRQRESDNDALARLAGNRNEQTPRLRRALQRITWTRRSPNRRAA
jgi:hypothetical protein